ncbi:flagellin N-terminal helical domain-containing protein [Heyndrickxia oleronia]|jgi:flagellin|uniref:flagellin N-terminal helical domain-containing protein n=1 Tax=Heyndrickxia oleronia TaxID=38875 RepID=UPI00242DC6B0|nr:flagellin [Heyndrickxia oleronia]MCI1589971.1 flagellin [Heyndrickxia oleronia]MCI1613403.1 flagellin [Heyndrickxia oleronia]MCI1744689.1 flagellin [Heyndrickxia oleronia]MCI1761352.1 flagellin [Heyndrickxia oleronia]
MIINHNIAAMNAYRMYNRAITAQSRAMERLSSGLRINRAADDPAGLAISEKMRAQIRGLNQASRNAQDAISLIQTGEGALNETHAILQRMRELSVQAANDTLSDADRNAIQEEIDQLTEEITRIGNDTQFNTMKLLDGSKSSYTIQIGANAGQTMVIEISDMRAEELGLTDSGNGGKGYTSKGTLDMSSHESASSAIDKIDQAMKTVSSQRSKLGAYSNRLEHTINNLENTAENLTAAESRIRDADLAKEMMEYTKQSILAQVAMVMMAQANQQQSMILQLLKVN